MGLSPQRLRQITVFGTKFGSKELMSTMTDLQDIDVYYTIHLHVLIGSRRVSSQGN